MMKRNVLVVVLGLCLSVQALAVQSKPKWLVAIGQGNLNKLDALYKAEGCEPIWKSKTIFMAIKDSPYRWVKDWFEVNCLDFEDNDSDIDSLEFSILPSYSSDSDDV